MKIKYISLIAIFLITLSGCWEPSVDKNYQYVDFDKSMKTKNYQNLMNNENNRYLLNLFRNIYNKCNALKINKTQLRIPKVIHQIWLGSPFPEKYKKFQESWLHCHPDWEFKLWTEKDIKSFNWKNRYLFDRTPNYGEKSDIWRYEILEQFGGLYIDTDYECLKSLEVLHYCYDFYIGIQPLDTNLVQLGIGIIGSIPHHPLLQYAIEKLRSTYKDNEIIIVKTGPIFFSKVLYNYAHKLGLRDCVLPASYFYPCGYEQRGGDCDWIKPESFAVHHWAGSWLSKEAFVK